MNETADDRVRYPIETLHRQATAILTAWGLDEPDARVSADALVDADVRGIDTHGVSLLALYSRWIDSGKFHLTGEKPRVEREGPTHALLDGRGGLGFAVSVQATDMAVEKARAMGLAAVTVRDSHHFGAAGYYARRIAEAGLIGLASTSSKVVCVVPPGGSRAALGTNPIAYAIPRRDGPPVVFDIATSTAAGNRVRMHHLNATPLPEGWVVDGKGQPVTDPHEGFHLVYDGGEGGLTPVGAHKGYGISLLVHFLSGTLPGGMFPATGRPKANGGDNIGHFFLAIDPTIYRGADAFFGDVEDVVTTLRQTPAADPKHPVLVPGDIENATERERREEGVPLAPTLIKQLRELATAVGAQVYLE